MYTPYPLGSAPAFYRFQSNLRVVEQGLIRGRGSGVARAAPEGGSLGQGSFEERQQSHRIPSKSINHAKKEKNHNLQGGGQFPLPPLATPLRGGT